MSTDSDLNDFFPELVPSFLDKRFCSKGETLPDVDELLSTLDIIFPHTVLTKTPQQKSVSLSSEVQANTPVQNPKQKDECYLDSLVVYLNGNETEAECSRRLIEYNRINHAKNKRNSAKGLTGGPRKKRRLFHPLILKCKAYKNQLSTGRSKASRLRKKIKEHHTQKTQQTQHTQQTQQHHTSSNITFDCHVSFGTVGESSGNILSFPELPPPELSDDLTEYTEIIENVMEQDAFEQHLDGLVVHVPEHITDDATLSALYEEFFKLQSRKHRKAYCERKKKLPMKDTNHKREKATRGRRVLDPRIINCSAYHKHKRSVRGVGTGAGSLGNV